MCRMTALVTVGGVAEKPLPVWQHLVGAPHSLRFQANHGNAPPGDEPGHDDSWGVGWFDHAGQVSLIRQTGSAADSAHYVFASETAARGGAGSGPAVTAIGHLRKASCGDINSENAHPIRAHYGEYGRDSLFVAHNGTLYRPLLETLRADLADASRSEARSDSDTVVLAGWLAVQAGKGSESGESVADALTEGLCELFRRAIEVAPDGDLTKAYSGVNLLIAHKGGLLTLRQFSRDADYYTLSARPLGVEGDGDAVGWVISSEPTDTAPGWEPLTPGTLYVYSVAENEETVRSVVVV